MTPHTHKLVMTMQKGELVVFCKFCKRTEAEIKEAK
jgi:hypothetical protein